MYNIAYPRGEMQVGILDFSMKNLYNTEKGVQETLGEVAPWQNICVRNAGAS